MKQLFVQAQDVLLFRDGRPFDAADDHLARSIFPPLPTVMQGMVRSRYLAFKDVLLHDKNAIIKAVGTSTDYGPLRLRGPFMRLNDKLYMPVPADVYFDAADGVYKPLQVLARPAGQVGNIAGMRYLLGPPQDTRPSKHEPGIVSIEDVRKSLDKGARYTDIALKTLYDDESRYGNGLRGASKSADLGRLYQVRYVRLREGAGLHLDVAAHWPDWTENQGVLALGGESRAAYFSSASLDAKCLVPELPTLIESAPECMRIHGPDARDQKLRFKVVLCTPAYFEAGWQPENGNWSKLFTGAVTLVAAAIARPRAVGGFDIAQQSHKPSSRYVDSGSVYYFEADSPVAFKDPWFSDSKTDNLLGQIGFGQGLVGPWRVEPSA
jgi:CRISPR-associated protein Cmr3